MTKSQKQGCGPYYTARNRFFWTCCFRQLLDNVKLIIYMKFQNIFMSGCRLWTKKHQKFPHFSSHLRYPKIFFTKIALCHFSTNMVPQLHANNQKNLITVSEIFKDGQTGVITQDLFGLKPGSKIRKSLEGMTD